MRPSDQIISIAPGISPAGLEIIDETLAFRYGAIEVVTDKGAPLGRTSYRAPISAQVVVSVAGVSKGSGGELYRFESLHTPDADSYLI